MREASKISEMIWLLLPVNFCSKKCMYWKTFAGNGSLKFSSNVKVFQAGGLLSITFCPSRRLSLLNGHSFESWSRDTASRVLTTAFL